MESTSQFAWRQDGAGANRWVSLRATQPARCGDGPSGRETDV